MSIIEYLSNGIYNDKTGVALQNTSPQQANNDTENNQEIKENRTMNKKQIIRIKENHLKQIVMESVKTILEQLVQVETFKCCPMCGNQLKQGDNFCSKCGANIKELINRHNTWVQQQQTQQMSQQPQSMQQHQPTQQQNAIDQQVQGQMSNNLRLQQQMANKIHNKTLNRMG